MWFSVVCVFFYFSGLWIWTPRIIWPWFKSSVHSCSQFPFSALTMMRASQNDVLWIMLQSMACSMSSGSIRIISYCFKLCIMSFIIKCSALSFFVAVT